MNGATRTAAWDEAGATFQGSDIAPSLRAAEASLYDPASQSTGWLGASYASFAIDERAARLASKANPDALAIMASLGPGRR